MSDGDTLHDQPHAPVHPDMSAAAAPLPPDDTILAARCPLGWRRDPMSGRPVMPCLGRLLFKCDPDDVPTHLEVRRQLHELFDYTDSMKPCWVNLIGAILGDARVDKLDGGSGLSQDTEKYLSDCIDEVLRFRGTVRIRRAAAGWEEVPDAAAAGGAEQRDAHRNHSLG